MAGKDEQFKGGLQSNKHNPDELVDSDELSDLMHDDAGGMKDLMNSAIGKKSFKTKGHDDDDKKKKGDDKSSESLEAQRKKFMKRMMQAKLGGETAGAGTILYMGYKMLMWLKMMLLQGIAMVQGLVAGVIASVMSAVSAVASFLGASIAVAAMIMGGAVTAVITGVVVVVLAVTGGAAGVRDAASICVPSTSGYNTSELDLINNGEASAQQEAIANQIWSVVKTAGFTVNNAAAMLGNFDIESGIDPTAVETIYNERYHIGPSKAAATAAMFDVMKIDSSYGSRFPNIKRVGIGLGQWTDTGDGARGNSQLRDYASTVNKDWFTVDAQLGFMFGGDNSSRTATMKYFASADAKNLSIAEATNYFLVHWEGNPNNKVAERTKSAQQWAVRITDMTIDKSYADSILSSANMSQSDMNNAIGNANKSDGCDSTLGESSGKGVADGTGEVPTDLGSAWAWNTATLPASLRKYAHDPSAIGLALHGPNGWFEHSGQCVDFSNSYMSLLYSKSQVTFGDGDVTAKRWSEVYGGSTTSTPSAGAVFSCFNTGAYGHTGIVEHVFADGTILVIEQNVKGYSGADNGMNDTWSWRIIRPAEYKSTNSLTSSWDWSFFKPSETPQWKNFK